MTTLQGNQVLCKRQNVFASSAKPRDLNLGGCQSAEQLTPLLAAGSKFGHSVDRRAADDALVKWSGQPSQDQVDRFLPPCEVPHRIDTGHPVTMGGMTLPQETLAHRMELNQAMKQVPAVLEEHRANFRKEIGRDVSGAVEAYCTDDAESVFITSGSISTTMKTVIDKRRERGEKVGMLRIKMFRPFPVEEVRRYCGSAKKVGVLDRNCSADSGGIFWQEVCAAMQVPGHPLIQGYLTGVGGSDIIPKAVHEVVDDLLERNEAGEPVWKGM